MFASNCHLLLGLIAVEGGTSGRVMASLGITVTWARKGLQHGQAAVNSPVQRADVELEPSTRATLAAAADAASCAGTCLLPLLLMVLYTMHLMLAQRCCLLLHMMHTCHD